MWSCSCAVAHEKPIAWVEWQSDACFWTLGIDGVIKRWRA
jgi:hypothetical protein